MFKPGSIFLDRRWMTLKPQKTILVHIDRYGSKIGSALQDRSTRNERQLKKSAGFAIKDLVRLRRKINHINSGHESLCLNECESYCCAFRPRSGFWIKLLSL